MKRFLIVLAKVLAALIVLLLLVAALFLGWLKWSGERDWKRAEAELRAKGEKLTFEELVPPMPPEKENFFADPIWQELADLVPVTKKSDGVEYVEWEPRVPEEKRLINQWKTPLSPAEQEEIKARFPQQASEWKPNQKDFPKLFQGSNSSEDRLSITKSIAWHLTNSSDPVQRRQLAQLQLDLMKPAAPLLLRITELLKRPLAYFPIQNEHGTMEFFRPADSLLRIAQFFHIRATAELELGDYSSALADSLTLLRLSSVDKAESLLISRLVGLSILQMGLSVINSGLEHHQWNAEEVVEFQKSLEFMDLVKNLCFTLRGERAYFDSIDQAKVLHLNRFPYSLSPEVLYFMLTVNYSKTYHNALVQRELEILEKAPKSNVSTSLFDQALKSLQSNPIKKRLYIMETLALPCLDSAVQKTVEAQTEVSQTLIACALERYRLSHGSYPATLETLVPDYLAKLPNSPITGKSMNYRLLDDHNFLLWSPGWKLQTLDGKPGEFFGEGDIVWNQLLPRTSRENAASKP